MISRVTILCVLLVAGCTSAHSHPTPPACSSVWVVGTTLPTDYNTCNGRWADGAQAVQCPSGIGFFAAYRGQLFAMRGQEVHVGGPGAGDFDQLFAACYAR